MKALAFINQKGGTGKTTTAAALGEALQRKGRKVLFIDMDSQGNLSYLLQADKTDKTVLDLLQGSCTVSEAIVKTATADIIPSSPFLSSADLILTDTGKEYRLKEAIEPVKKKYDYIFVDVPPALGILTVNALTLCDSAIIPAQADILSLHGLLQLNSTVETVRKYCNPRLKIQGIVITRYNSRTAVSREILELAENIATQLNTRVFDVKIRENTAVKEAQATRHNLIEYAPKCNAAADYIRLAEEIF